MAYVESDPLVCFEFPGYSRVLLSADPMIFRVVHHKSHAYRVRGYRISPPNSGKATGYEVANVASDDA